MKKKIIFLLAVFMIIPFSVNAETLADYVTGLVDTDDSVVADDPDHNPRYVGANPNNYVLFNNELWRIVGVFDGKVKIVRNERLGVFSLDTSESNVNKGKGINEWSQTKIAMELNTDYLNYNLTEDVLWYSGASNAKNNYFDHTKVITKDAQKMITDATYYTGAWDHTTNRNNPRSVINALEVYGLEHSNSVGYWENTPTSADFNDNVERTFTWTGKVALLNISDYFLATSGSDIATREDCITNKLYDSYNDSNWTARECYKGDWLNNPSIKSVDDIFTMSPSIGYYGSSWGMITGNSTYNQPGAYNRTIKPVVHLKEDVIKQRGTGTETDPYLLYVVDKVTFDVDGGSNVESQEVSNNGKVTKPADPTKEDYKFLGWYTESGDLYDFDTVLSGDITLYAHWQFDYKIIEGKDQTFEDNDVVIKCNGKLEDLQKIKVGDNELDEENYTLESGSTILTLKKEYLSTLSVGTHNITFVYPDGSATTTLTIPEPVNDNQTTNDNQPQARITNPKTGDNIIFYITILSISIIGLGINIKRRLFNY